MAEAAGPCPRATAPRARPVPAPAGPRSSSTGGGPGGDSGDTRPPPAATTAPSLSVPRGVGAAACPLGGG